MTNNRSGFTLIELLVVMMVLGILFTMGMVLFNDVRGTSQNTAAKANVRVALVTTMNGYTQNANSFGSDTTEAIAQIEYLGSDGLSYTDDGGSLAPRQIFVQLDDAGTGYSGPVGQQITLCSESETGRAYCLRTNQEQAFPISQIIASEKISSLISGTTNIAYSYGEGISHAMCALPQPGSSHPDPWPPAGCEGTPAWEGTSTEASGDPGGDPDPEPPGDDPEPPSEPDPDPEPPVEVVYHQPFGWGMANHVGHGTWADSLAPTATDMSGVLSDKTVDVVSTGTNHSCVLAEGEAFCWGAGGDGQLGHGGGSSATPVAVNTSGVLEGKELVHISAGHFFTCAATDSEIFCWGRGNIGQLGNGSFSNSALPVAVNMSLMSGKTITKVEAGGGHVCAIASGEAFCWGGNNSGRLGNNSTANSNTPVAVNTSGVLSGRTVTDIGTGGPFTCAVADNLAFCWGSNGYRQLGNGSPNDSHVPVAVSTAIHLSDRTVTQISGGVRHACVIADDLAFCWGNNGPEGRLGNGGTGTASVPIPVSTSGVLSGKTIDQIRTGTIHSCVLAEEEAFCWGVGDNGRLGRNSTASSLTPIAVLMSGALDGKVLKDLSIGSVSDGSLVRATDSD